MEDQKAKVLLFKSVSGLVIVFAVLAVYSAFWGPLRKIADSQYPVRVVSVSAEGKATVAPDIAKISFSVVSDGLDPTKLADENNKKMNGAIAFVKSLGIDAKDIKTTQYNISPKYNYDRYTGQSTIYGYTMTQGVLITMRDFTKVPGLLAGVSEFGINQVSGVSFEVEDPEKYMVEARNMAFSRAKAKAQAMAEANGARIKRVVTFSEFEGGYPGPYFAKAEMGMGGDGGVPVPPTIEPGTQEVTVNVSVTYEIW